MSPEIKALNDRIAKLEQTINLVVKPSNYTFERPIKGGALGLRIGTSVGEKIAFFDKSPIVKQAAITSPAGGATVDTPARIAIDAIITTLENYGFVEPN